MASSLQIKTATLPAAPRGGAIVVYAAEGGEPQGTAADLWAATGLDWAAVTDAASFQGKQGQALDLIAPAGLDARRLIVLGSGKPAGTDPATAWTDRGGSLMGKLQAMRVTKAAVILDLPDATPERVADIAAGLRLRHYRFDRYKSPKTENGAGDKDDFTVTLHVASKPATDRAIAARMPVVDGTLLARDLVNEPANVLGTVEFAERAAALAEEGVAVEVLEERQLRKLGMNAMLAVSQGSARPPRLVVMQWHGGKKGTPPAAFVGKGVGFDSGGSSIKPAANMDDMKRDMGAAPVTGLMLALGARQSSMPLASSACRKHAERNRNSAGRHRQGHVRHDDRGHQHRRRRQARSGGRALVRP